jgi:DNA-directed RNA polymerase
MQGKRRKITLSKSKINETTKIPYINKTKQVNSLIPNFIHSMDASHIVMLIEKLNNKYNLDIITVHDCFGVHANYTELLSFLVKESFISIYGDKNCIDKFHTHALENIKAVYIVKDNIVIDKNDNMLEIPEKPVLGDLDLKAQLLESNYFIN